jgi:hypothetical protein
MSERIRFSGKGILVLLAAMALVTSFACGKKSGAEKAFSAAKGAAKEAAATVAPSSADAQNDYARPYLTDEKMARFIESLREDVNPFEVLFKGGQMMKMSDIEKKAQEYNGFARKYGFADFGDYMAVWGRIMVGEMLITSEEWKKSSVKMMEDTIRSAEESLKKPDLSPDMRTMYEEQIKSSKASIEESQKPDENPGLNAEDLALVAKYKAQIEEVTKKYKIFSGD